MAVLVDVGADVTKGEGPDTPTPICLAVLSGHKDMVDHLLQKGVTDVRRAFALAREKKMDDIIGGWGLSVAWQQDVDGGIQYASL